MSSRQRIRYGMGFIVAFALSLGSVGCASLGLGGQKKAEGLVMTLTLERTSFRPGDAVLCAAKLHNGMDKELIVPNLNAARVSFWLNEVGTDNMFRCEPAFSPLEQMGEMRTVEAGQKLERTFLFTRATRALGRYALIAKYEPSVLEANKKRDPVYARTPDFVVEGEAALQRDPEGLLTKEDAIRLAKERAGAEVKDAQAALVRNEAGFLDWWVNLEMVASGKAERSVKSYLVNPYSGVIRKEAKPFDEKAVSGQAEKKAVVSPAAAGLGQ